MIFRVMNQVLDCESIATFKNNFIGYFDKCASRDVNRKGFSKARIGTSSYHSSRDQMGEHDAAVEKLFHHNKILFVNLVRSALTKRVNKKYP